MQFKAVIITIWLLISNSIVNNAAAQSRHSWPDIDALFAPTSGPDRPAAAVAITWDGAPVYQQVYGMADVENQVPVSADSPFNLASVTKQFTAYAILQLADRQQIDLDSTVSTYLPELTHVDATVRDLMVQISGIASPSVGAFGAFGSGRSELLLATYDELPLAHPAGTSWAYNNNNYDLLSIIVERVSGQALPEYLASQVFQPLGMDDSFFPYGPGHTRENRAFGHVGNGESYRNVDTRDFQQSLVGAGGLISSLNDMVTWSNALYASDFETNPLSFEGQYRNGNPVSYGAGLNVHHDGPTAIYEHGGTSGATSTFTMYIPEYRASAIVLVASNIFQSEGGAQALAYSIRDNLFSEYGVNVQASQQIASSIPVTDTLVSQLNGQWFGEVNGRLQLVSSTVVEGNVTLAVANGPTLTLAQVSPGMFTTSAFPEMRIRFDGKSFKFWDHDKTLGWLDKVDPPKSVEGLNDLTGHYSSAALDNAIWTITVEDGSIVAMAPGGRTAKLQPISETLFISLEANAALEIQPSQDSAPRWVLTGGQLPRIELERTSLMPALPIVRVELSDENPDKLNPLFDQLKDERSSFSFSEAGLNQLGYQLLREQKTEFALAVFTFNCELFPSSINAWDSLADAYLAAGQNDDAIDAYERILSLDKDLISYREMIATLNQGENA